MSPETNVSSDVFELPTIAGKELWRATYMALALFALVGWAAMMFQSDLDRLLGGQRDFVILAAAALILIATNMSLIRRASRRIELRASQVQVAASLAVRPAEQAALMVEHHLRLDEAMGVQLKGVVGDTENAAMMLMLEVRKLSDAANTLMSYLDNSNMNARDMEHEIGESVAFIVRIDNFVRELPDRIQQDMAFMREAGKEIDELGKYVDVIKEVSKKTDFLARNVSIEAASVGEFGAGFVEVADEICKLSEQSTNAAAMIEQSLTVARNIRQNGHKFNFLQEYAQQICDADKVVESIRSLQESHENMRQYYQTLFSVVTEHNTCLAAGLGEILGHIQFQDVVRQRIERMENAVAKRNVLFQAFAQGLDTPDADLLELAEQMRVVLDEYLALESRHAPAANNASEQDAGLPQFELF
ncbi:methyl-accepting chemotaxis protein [Methylobacter tundripaludum]|uniref:Chemotaxis sensory transducer n=1 Tax=Methylobacter tundripaludum (strain ATCC BAA-1195 / DSM 17260 / SV96) TaxID=697282 RepID=G3IWW6_METTV|nr:methyl-accepting chemotaxis protein [Methylobacter tundripaludum]EGW23321.1 chemotaxis sensory transducer [Methylobacter tundripaludum SV96]